MAQIQDFVREGSWPVLSSTAPLLLVGDIIDVAPTRADEASVEILRNGRIVARGPGSLVQSSIVVNFGFATMQLTRDGTKLDFKVRYGSGPSPGGGGTSGGPEG